MTAASLLSPVAMYHRLFFSARSQTQGQGRALEKGKKWRLRKRASKSQAHVIRKVQLCATVLYLRTSNSRTPRPNYYRTHGIRRARFATVERNTTVD